MPQHSFTNCMNKPNIKSGHWLDFGLKVMVRGAKCGAREVKSWIN